MEEDTVVVGSGNRNKSSYGVQHIPQKYRSKTAKPTGCWKHNYDLSRPVQISDYQASVEGNLLVYPGQNHDFTDVANERHAFTRTAKTHPGIDDGVAHRLWLFIHGVKIGDWVVLEASKPAIGQITGPCVFEDGSYRRAARWHWIADGPIGGNPISKAVRGRNLWGFTTLEPIEFKRILQALGQESLVSLDHILEPSNEIERNTTPPRLEVIDIANRFAAGGLNYTATQIADFYTALQTKGFVVMSGISGTGKSKIAQGFTELLPGATVTEIAGPDPVTASQALEFRVSAKENWAAVWSSQSHLFPRMNQNFKYDVNFMFEGGIYRGSYKSRTLNFGKPTLYLILGKALTQKLRAAAGEHPVYAQFRSAPNEDSLPEILITADEPELDLSTQEVDSIEIANTLFLPVRPDWRDSTSLLGYYNPLTQTFEWTDFLRFILNAADNYRSDTPIAWFVILDEMNLAHVEYYFADLLSVLESGRNTDPTNKSTYGFTREPLRLTYPDDIVNEAPLAEIYLPPNLYIIGTVNMDETTHAFSPKVLDRAFTMELTEVDFSGYPRAITDTSAAAVSDIDKRDFLAVFSQDGAFPQIRKSDVHAYVESNPEIRESLQRLNSALAVYRHHFGYRVFDEIVQFLANAERNGMFADQHTALDSAVFMKVLPKFSGSEARVGRPLAELIAWSQDPLAQGEGAKSLERTLVRALYMQDVLRSEGFVTAF